MKYLTYFILFFPFSLFARTAILLSLDGVAADYLENEKYETFDQFKKDGVFGRLLPPFPSLTFPSHISIATGCTPGEHGIVANRFIDKKRGEFKYSGDPEWMECEPIWVSVERQNRKSAIVQWPVSYGKWHGISASRFSSEYDPKI